MQVNKEELQQILNRIKPGLATKDIVEQMTHYIFTGKKLLTYNDHICIQAPFETKFKCSIRAKNLVQLLNKIKGDKIVLRVKGKEFLLNNKKNSQKAGFTLIQSDKELNGLLAELDKIIEDGKWKSIPKRFIEGVGLCMFSCSKNESKGTQTCLFVKKDKILSTDGFRASCFTLDKRMKPFFLKATSAMELVKFGVITHYILAQNWICFKTEDDYIFSCRIFKGEFNDIESIINKVGKDGIELIFPEELNEALETVSVMTDEDNVLQKYVKIDFKKNKIICSRKKDRGWVKEIIKTDFTPEKEISILINPIFLSQILNKINSVRLKDTMALFEFENFQHILLTSTGD